MGAAILFIFIGIVVIAILFLKAFDQMSGRGPEQISDGMEHYRNNEGRIPCPYCAEMIMPNAKICPFCKSNISREAGRDVD